MVDFSRTQRGATLIELMLAITISAIIGYSFTQVQHYIMRFTLVTQAKQETVQESRTALTVMQKMIQQGNASTFVIDQSTSQPPYSRIYFQATTPEGVDREFYFYQVGKTLYMDYRNVGAQAWRRKVLTLNVRFLSFFYPITSDNRFLSVTLTVSKKTAEQKETFLQMALQKIRILNS
jgi:prepilin-type N-terminal cleavage/methylation domain-containing protein